MYVQFVTTRAYASFPLGFLRKLPHLPYGMWYYEDTVTEPQEKRDLFDDACFCSKEEETGVFSKEVSMSLNTICTGNSIIARRDKSD